MDYFTAEKMELTGAEISSLKITAGNSSRVLIENFSSSVTGGKIIALTGLNGTGKSTLLHCLAGLRPFYSGTIHIKGQNMNEIPATEKSKLVSLVFTSQENIPWMDVYSFVATGRSPYTSLFGNLTEEDEKIIAETLQQTELTDFKFRFISELSDGEKQRCLIARALVQNTPLLLLDEPTAFLDIRHKNKISALLRKICDTKKISVIFSSHDIHIAKKYADEIWMIENQQIKISSPQSFSEDVFL
jgi:iron complex transport system ATP-binding protein